jgi:hypothetical protein
VLVQKPFAALTTAVLAVALLAVAPATAHAYCDETVEPVTHTGANPERLIIGIAKAQSVGLNARTVLSCWKLAILDTVGEANGPSVDLMGVQDETGVNWSGKVTIRPADLDNAMAGNVATNLLVYTVEERDNTIVEILTDNSLHLYRASRLSVNASPEPVKRGRTITVTGTLQRANWDQGVYQGYRNRTVQLMFRTKNGSYATVKSVTSGVGGKVKTTVKADQDGYYTWNYAGNSTTGPSRPAGDFVNVR